MEIGISDHIAIVLIKDNITFDTDVEIVQQKLENRFNITYRKEDIVAILEDLYLNTIPDKVYTNEERDF